MKCQCCAALDYSAPPSTILAFHLSTPVTLSHTSRYLASSRITTKNTPSDFNKWYLICYRHFRPVLTACACSQQRGPFFFMLVKKESSPLEGESGMKTATTESPQSSRDDQPFKTPPERLAPPTPILTPAPPATFAPPIPQTNMPTTAPKQAQAQDPYFTYKRNCRLAWIGYLGLLNKVKLREGPDGLPCFIGMPPEYSTSRISPNALERLQKEAMGDPRNSFICLQDVLTILRNRPLHTHLVWHAMQLKLVTPSVPPTSLTIHESLK